MNRTKILIITFCTVFITGSNFAQDLNNDIKRSSIKALQSDEKIISEGDSKNIDRFDRWSYSEKKSDPFFYFSPLYQYGTGINNASNLHHDLGIIYRWFIVDNENFKMNFHGWAEQTSFWAGDTVKDFSSKTGMISSPNASSETDHDVSVLNFYLELFLFDEKLDITVGKMDPLYVTTFSNYSGWDKYNYFSKSSASDPVPDYGEAMGLYTEYHLTKKFSFGGLVVDNEPRNNMLYIPKFNDTSWNYMGFLRFKFPGTQNLYSDHNIAYYHQSSNATNPSGSGFVYTGNQGLSKNTILVLKVSNGSGRIDKLNAAYMAGLTFKNAFNRSGDQAGFATIINEKGGKYEYGLDSYYRFFLNQYVNIAPNFQAYYTINDRVNTVFGLRAFISY